MNWNLNLLQYQLRSRYRFCLFKGDIYSYISYRSKIWNLKWKYYGFIMCFSKQHLLRDGIFTKRNDAVHNDPSELLCSCLDALRHPFLCGPRWRVVPSMDIIRWGLGSTAVRITEEYIYGQPQVYGCFLKPNFLLFVLFQYLHSE